jgi:hypothetical protein
MIIEKSKISRIPSNIQIKERIREEKGARILI